MDHYIFASSHIGHFTPQLNINKICIYYYLFCLCKKQTASFGMTSFILLLLFCRFFLIFINVIFSEYCNFPIYESLNHMMS